METIRITALRHSAFYSPLLVTITQGFLEAEGLKPDYRPAGPGESVADALRDGRAHLSQSAVSTSFSTLEAGKSCELVHFAQINERDGFFIAGREPDATFEWNRLRGQSVLVDHFFQPLAMLRYGLHRQGLDWDELRVVDAGEPGAMRQAFLRGEGAYVHLQGPVPQQLQLEGRAFVLAAVGDAVGRVAFSSLCATRAWVESDMARAFTRAFRNGKAFVVDSTPAEVAKAVRPLLPGVTSEALTGTIQAYQAMGCWTPEIAIDSDAYNNLLDVFEYNGDITRRHPQADCVVPAPA